MDRSQILNLPQWEFVLLYDGIYSIEARQQLAMINSTSIGMGGIDKKEREKFITSLENLSTMRKPAPKEPVQRPKGREFADILSFISK